MSVGPCDMEVDSTSENNLLLQDSAMFLASDISIPTCIDEDDTVIWVVWPRRSTTSLIPLSEDP